MRKAICLVIVDFPNLLLDAVLVVVTVLGNESDHNVICYGHIR